jgi:hypothetical protein
MFAKFIFAMLVGLLLCSVATEETPELLRLANDTSNDFSLLNTTQQGVAAATAAPARDESRQTVQTPDVVARPEAWPITIAFHSTPKDTLHNLCILRT